MRAREILDENYSQSLESDLNNLLVGAKALGSQRIDTGTLVKLLNQMGYSVSPNSLMLLLSKNPLVLNATPTVIKMAPPEGTTSSDGNSSKDSAARVSDMASKATKIG